MKQINNGFADYYYLTDDGKVFNKKLGTFSFVGKYKLRLVNTNGEYKNITLKELYFLVYNKIYCIDNIEDLEGEIWKEIKGSNGFYYVSNYGRVKSLKGYNAILLKYRKQSGYYRVDLILDGVNRSMLVHKLVAMAFLENNKGDEAQIHHKDFNTLNCKLSNLEYLTVAEHKAIHSKRKGEVNGKK